MTVRELIAMLQTLDQDTRVYVRGYEDGVDDVGAAQAIKVVRDYWSDTWYYGNHSTSEYDAKDTDRPMEPGYELVPPADS